MRFPMLQRKRVLRIVVAERHPRSARRADHLAARVFAPRRQRRARREDERLAVLLVVVGGEHRIDRRR